jgi:hypothetical protein
MVEKVGRCNTGDSTISHKAEVLLEAKGEGPQRERNKDEGETANSSAQENKEIRRQLNYSAFENKYNLRTI